MMFEVVLLGLIAPTIGFMVYILLFGFISAILTDHYYQMPTLSDKFEVDDFYEHSLYGLIFPIFLIYLVVHAVFKKIAEWRRRRLAGEDDRTIVPTDRNIEGGSHTSSSLGMAGAFIGRDALASSYRSRESDRLREENRLRQHREAIDRMSELWNREYHRVTATSGLTGGRIMTARPEASPTEEDDSAEINPYWSSSPRDRYEMTEQGNIVTSAPIHTAEDLGSVSEELDGDDYTGFGEWYKSTIKSNG